ncbi:MAG: CU044_2847 family protein [Pirellulaceae bacterium]
MGTDREVVAIAIGDTTVYATVTFLGGDELVSWKKKGFDGVTKAIGAIATEVRKAVDLVDVDVARVDFGLEIAAESGELIALLVNGKSTASLTVSLEWSRRNNKT